MDLDVDIFGCKNLDFRMDFWMFIMDYLIGFILL